MFKFIKRAYGKDKEYYRFVWDVFKIIPDNIELYKLALVHRSASVVLEDRSVINNERLEFLGDSVIGVIVSEMLFIDYPEMNEGMLTQLRSRIVNRNTLNQLALTLKIDRELVANPSSINIHKQNINGDAFEALVGALYLDKGYNHANRAVISLFDKNLDIEKMHHTERDFKSRIIEWCQKHRKEIEFSSEMGDDHSEASPNFEVTLYIDGVVVGFGIGHSKKEAEQRAAQKFYDNNDFEL